MSIGLFCPTCKRSSKLGTKKCKCGKSLRGTKKYRVQYKMPNGKWKSRVVDTLDLARSLEGQYRTDKIKEKDFGVHKAPKIEDVWEKYIAWAKVNKRSWNDDRTRWGKHVAQHVKNKPMDRITPRQIEKILDNMRSRKNLKGKPYAPATIKQALVLIKRVYNWAIKSELYNGLNPATKVDTPKFDNQVTNPLLKEDLERLLSYLSNWDNERAALLIKFALFSGRRRGEILKLKWKDVNFDAGYVTFEGANTKNKRSQSVPLNANCLAILTRCHELKLSDWVFASSTGAFYTTFENTWKRLKKSLSLPYRFHDLRHSFASYLASSGKVDILTLKELLGHRELKMTQRYAHLINGALQKGANVADEVIK